jgi:hypothetical protein
MLAAAQVAAQEAAAVVLLYSLTAVMAEPVSS